MVINYESVMKAFTIYSRLNADGKCGTDDYSKYMADDEIRNLINSFAHVQECVVIVAGEALHLVPAAKNSIFHVSNDYIKTKYLHSKATNGDLYLMYASIIVLIGEFYNSSKSVEASRDFILMEEWLERINDRLEALKEIGSEKLKSYESELKYNWTTIIDRWDALNDISETARAQDSRAKMNRYAFLNSVKRFLIDNELLQEDSQELCLTEKTKVIVQKYFMEEEYNRGILDFIYSFKRKEIEQDAIHIEN